MLRSFRFTLLAAAATTALSAGANAAITQINGGGSTLAAPTYLQEFSYFENNIDSSYNFNYGSVGSGSGTNAFINNNPTPDGFAAGTVVHFGASDSILTNNTVVNGANNQITAFQTTHGYPLIQIPAFGVPITVPFVDGAATAVTLNDTDLCGIFSGKLTNWNQTSAAATVPAGAITVVYRTDGSGTSFLLTQHLASACTTSNSNVTFTASTSFASEFSGSVVPANFVGANGSGGMKAALLGQTSAIGYVGPDYTSIAPLSPNTSSLLVASLVNATSGVAYLPTIPNTTTALSANSVVPSDVGSPPPSANPANWVPSIAQPSDGYPIVGYTNFLFSQCYAKSKVSTGLIEFLSFHYNNPSVYAPIGNSGFVILPNTGAATFVSAINSHFLTNSSSQNLNIANASVCTGKVGR
jgi:ABC-type phosphate transport system substrate-binding protein